MTAFIALTGSWHLIVTSHFMGAVALAVLCVPALCMRVVRASAQGVLAWQETHAFGIRRK